MTTAAEHGEKSWELSVQVDQKDGDESMKFKLRVKGDLHVGGLMLKLVEKISKWFRWVKHCCTLIRHTQFWFVYLVKAYIHSTRF